MCGGYYVFATSQCQLEDIYPTIKLQGCNDPKKVSASANNATGSTDLSLATIIRIMSVVAVCVTILIFIIYRRQKNKWHKLISSNQLTEDTYTIMISNIPVLDFPSPGESKGR